MQNLYNIQEDEVGFFFLTDTQTHYAIRFLHSEEYINENLSFSKEIYEFNFQAKKASNKSYYDLKIRNTILEVLKKFFAKNPLAIVSYVCDSADNKHQARAKLFNRWFGEDTHSESYHKKDFELKYEDLEIIGSVIYLKNHPQSTLIEDFIKTTTRFYQDIKNENE